MASLAIRVTALTTSDSQGKADMHPCEDCGTAWPSQRAADECATLDAAETRAARRPPREHARPHGWDDD